MKNFHWTPARLTTLSFFGLIFFGTCFLILPFSTTNYQGARVIDALFTATSATCVTGLAVQDTATYFTFFGQIVILLLTQLGGLGIMTLSASLPILFGRQLSISRRDLFQSVMDEGDYEGLRHTVKKIIKYTLTIESIGALILAIRFYTEFKDLKKAAFYGIFHAVSAFCNAGFALFSDNLVLFRKDPVVNLVIMTLIVLGGIGFIVLIQVSNYRKTKNLDTHSKLTLIITGILIALPAAYIFFTEFSRSFINFSFGEKIFTSFFQSVTTRTAGFNTIDLTLLHESVIFVMIILMFIGAAPGSTGGGVKVTTIGILLLSLRSIFLGRDQIEIFGRQIPQDLVTKSIAIVAISFALVTSFVIVILTFEPFSLKEILFETVSAFGTVGLSLNLSPKLSDAGKFLISLMMFIGRIGPLTLVFLIGSGTQKLYYKLPRGKISVG